MEDDLLGQLNAMCSSENNLEDAQSDLKNCSENAKQKNAKRAAEVADLLACEDEEVEMLQKKLGQLRSKLEQCKRTADETASET